MGSTFAVHLPLVSAHQKEEVRAAAKREAEVDSAVAKASLDRVKVVALDDDVDSLAVIARILRKNGAVVQTAGSVEEALKTVQDFVPQVVLSDIGMPDHDGYEFIRRLRAMPGGHAIPAVALTALARSEDRTRALRAGFQMHVAKPVDAHELVAVVQNLAALRAHSV